MPAVASKPQAATLPAPAVKPPAKTPLLPRPEERAVAYPEVMTVAYCREETRCHEGQRKKPPLSVEEVKKILGWERESDYAARMIAADPKLAGHKIVFEENIRYYDFEDRDGEKVRCWHNCRNREFDPKHCNKLAQEMVTRKWRFNLETIIIGQTKIVESGQHRLIARVWAQEDWDASPELQERFPEGPLFETLVAYGADEISETIQTLDNVKPRTLADTMSASDAFNDLKSVNERREATRSLAVAVDHLWKRTGQGGADATSKFQTHSSSQEFLANHKRLLKTVRHLFEENKGRAISLLKLSPGQCASLCYLMASSGSDGAAYREGEPRSEDGLDWKLAKKADAFWTELAKGVPPAGKQPSGELRACIISLRGLKEVEEGLGGRLVEEHSILAKAWARFRDGKPVGKADLSLEEHYSKSPETGAVKFVDAPTLDGIDLGPSGTADEAEQLDAPITPEQAEAEKKKIRDEAAAELLKRREDQKGIVNTTASKPVAAAPKPTPAPAASSNGNKPAKPVVKPAVKPTVSPTKKPVAGKPAAAKK